MFINISKYKILYFLISFLLFFLDCYSSKKPNKNIFLDWTTNEGVLKIDGKLYDFDKKQSINKILFLDVLAEEISIVDTLYVDLSDEEKSYFKKDIQDSEFLIKKETGINRNKTSVVFDIIPIRKNKKTGKLQKLFSFNIDYRDKKIENAKKDVNSIFHTGSWYKISTSKDGVYIIDYQDLLDFGIDVNNLDPRNIRIYGNGGTMLPKLNQEEVFMSPQQKSIFVYGESDGVFNQTDYILFFGQSPTDWIYGDNFFMHKKNLYDDYSYYFLNYDLGPGDRIADNYSLNNPDHTTNTFDNFLFLENDLVNFIKSGEKWYGESFGINQQNNFDFDLHNLNISDSISYKIKLAARAVTPNSCFFSVNLNGSNQQNTPVSSVGSDYLDPYVNLYSIENKFLSSQENVTFNISLNNLGGNNDGWLDYIVLNYRAKLNHDNRQLLFRDSHTVDSINLNNITQFNINSYNSQIFIWDITNPIIPKNQVYNNQSNGVLDFSVQTNFLKEFVCFDLSQCYSPVYHGIVDNQNLASFKDIDFVIISSENLISEAQRLADFHTKQDNLIVEVVSDRQIFNEFSSGSNDVSAIRNFVKNIYHNSSSNLLKYLLIFGDGSYDPKNRYSGNDNYILTYQSSNSIDPISSYVSDDFFGLLDDNENLQSSGNLNFIDIGVGRMPVTSLQDATHAVDKIIKFYDYQSAGSWKNDICFVGDDKDESWDTNHSMQAESIADFVFDNHLRMNVDKIFLDSYTQEVTSGGQRCPDVNNAINRKVEKGALLINYTGHGGELGWAHERILGIDDINSWNNKDKFPFFVTATCEFSRFDDPDRLSAGEHVFLKQESGSIALFSTTRVVYSAPNYDLNYSFIENLFDYSNIDATVGDLIRITKNNVLNKLNPNHRNFTLFGDPALSFNLPKNNVVLDSYPDTIKAYGEYIFSGHIKNNQKNIISDFNGELFVTCFDKKRTLLTLGQDASNIFSYEIQDNVIFKGVASVVNGYFNFRFIVPRDINYSFDSGKFSFYAKGNNTNGFMEAAGFNDNIVIGGTHDSIVDQLDNIAPSIDLFMNDTNFISGGITNESPLFIAHLFDSHGINTTGNGIGHDIVVVLDDDNLNPIILNDYYIANIDDYKSGKVNYQFYDLSPGQHKLTFKVWDVFNVSSEKEILFNVVNSENILTETHVYPNPAKSSLYFYFDNNQNTDEVELEISIFDYSGNLVKTLFYNTNVNSYKIGPVYWNCRSEYNNNLSAGIYIYRAKINYIKDDKSKIDFVSGKIVIIN